MGTVLAMTPRIAIVHEWLTGMRGGEKCVEVLCELHPDATLFTLLHVRGSVSPVIERMTIRTSFVQHLPLASSRYRHYLPLFPLAIRSLDLDPFDIVISSNHCVAKGVRTRPDALHICYCHTPMRYIWGMYDQYFRNARAGLLTRAGMGMVVNYLRRFDVRTARNPHYFVANSQNVRERIGRIYHREADVIYPPVDTHRFTDPRGPGDYFLVVSALVPYKRVDLAIGACNRTGDRLVIVGTGPDRESLEAMAGPTVDFAGWVDDEHLGAYYAGCRAVIFPGEEDFGIVPVEALASGRPVIAFARGGALETITEQGDIPTGVMFHEQTVDALLGALHRFASRVFDPRALRTVAQRFDREVYREAMRRYISLRWETFRRKSE